MVGADLHTQDAASMSATLGSADAITVTASADRAHSAYGEPAALTVTEARVGMLDS